MKPIKRVNYKRHIRWTKSAGGKAIDLYESLGPSMERPILVIGGVHGDEPEGVWLAEFILEWLKEHSPKVPWLLVPCINPDGYESNTRVNNNGVDLNRNFPSADWTNKFDQSRYNPGSFPQSEPETRAIVELVEHKKPQLIIHCHSWHPCIVYTGEPGKRDSLKLASSSGYEAKADIGYPTPGSLGNWAWNSKKIPVICIEEQEKTPKDKIWAHFEQGIAEIFLDAIPRV